MFDCDSVGKEWAEQNRRPPSDLEITALLQEAPESNKGALSVAVRRIIAHCLAKQNGQDDTAASSH
ncbi:MAG: hypothetical protein PHX93_00655 [Candidatus Peribacteraceae bacterium]|nr:hypothetical protein [Candidatus Peribacteraceae bacterium]